MFETCYRAIAQYYGNRKAKRSRISYMNHINEGLVVLNCLKASPEALAGYCLHPIVQNDDDLTKTFPSLVKDLPTVPLLLAMEYRSVANAYLSKREIKNLGEIHLSPLPDVNHMLIADKVQNYKDFVLYHSQTHPRRKALDRYFRNWLERLGVGEALHQQCLEAIRHEISNNQPCNWHQNMQCSLSILRFKNDGDA